MKTVIVIALIFILSACAYQPNTQSRQSYAEWRKSREVEIHYERGYKDVNPRSALPFRLGESSEQ